MCGGGARGKLGLGHTNNARSPLLVHALSQESITKVALGVYHTVCLTIAGKVYAWGDATWVSVCMQGTGGGGVRVEGGGGRGQGENECD